MKYFMNIDQTFRHFAAQQFTLWHLLLLLLCAPSLSYATHIVGGEVGYRCLGNERYEIIVRVYRDCASGTEPFDPIASVSIFDHNTGLLLQDVRIAATPVTPLDNNLDACIVAQSRVCVETMTYKATVSLPFRTGGYQIVYQRCCRNRDIANVVNPLGTGATYDIWLTEPAMRRCNNSATFRRWPDIYICNNRPLDFDHSAFDADGDSLVYRLCTPFQGATFANPRPQPANPPPYDTLELVGPRFSLSNMLGAGEPLRINSSSGLLTARPGQAGKFVVGICVDEYDPKTKQLISSTRRDFQYNVQNCEGVAAEFFAPEVQCDSLKVSFRNESLSASNYRWSFGTSPTVGTSTEANPMYTFPAYDTYNVSLIAEPNTTCADTFSRQIKLIKSGIIANFKAEVLPCDNESIIRLQDLSTDSSAAIVKRIWKVTFGDTGQITATGADTLVRLPANVLGTITLTVVNANGCEKTHTQNFSTAGGQNPTDGIPDTIRACVGATIPLNPNGIASAAYTYHWEPMASIDNPNAVNPKYTVAQNGVITLTITANSAQICTFTKTITLFASPRPIADFGANGGIGNDPIVVTSCDGRTLSLTNKSSNADSVKWIIGDLNNPVLVSNENNPTLTLGDTGTYTLTLIAYGECNDTLQKTIRMVKQETDVDFIFNYTSCILNGSTIKLVDVSNNPGVQIASRTWKLSDGRTSIEDAPSFSFTDTGRVTVTLVIRTTQGCLDSASQSIVKAPITGVDFPDTVVVCRGMPLQIPGNNNPNLIYMWLPETGLDDPTVGNPIFSPQQSTLYTVNISVPGIPTCQINDTMLTVVPVNMGITVLGAGADGTPACTPQTTLTASTKRPATFRWLDANGNELGKGATFTATVATQRNLIVEATDENGCKEKLEISLLGQPIVFAAPDSVMLCTNESLRINTTQEPGQILTYSWTPLAAFESGALTANPLLAATPGIKEIFVQVRNASGCTLTDSVQVIIVDANHNLDFTPEIQCDGNTVVFTNSSTNAFGYLWNFGDGTTSTEENPTHKYAAAGNFTVTLTLRYDVSCRKTVSKAINITTGTSIGLKVPNNLTTCGETVTLTAEGNPGTSFKWTTKQGQLLSSDASVSVNPPPGTTVYYVTATKAPGCTETDSVSVTDNGVDVSLVTPSGSNQIDQCDAEGVQVEVRNNVPSQQLTYRWTPAFNVVSGGNTATPVLRPTEIGVNVITSIVSNQFECEDTLTVTINLGSLDSGLPDTVQVCPGVATPLAPNASSEYTYQWSPGTNLSATNVRNPSFTGTVPTTYLVTVTRNSGGISCQVVDTVVVTIGSKPELKVSTMDTIACFNVTLILTATGASGYTWLLDGTPLTPLFGINGDLAVTATQGADFRYTVIGRNELGCTDTISGIRVRFVDFDPGQFTTPLSVCKGDTVALHPNGNPAFQYQWSPSAGLDLSKPYSPVAILSQTTQFSVTITDPATRCIKERAIEVNVNSIEGFKASNDTTICTATGGLTLRADANGNNVTFRWLNAAGTQIGTGKTISLNPAVGVNRYIVEASNGTCSQKDTVKVTVADFKPGDLTSPQVACAGSPLPLNPNGNPAYTYAWSPSTGLDLTNPHNPVATLRASVTYTVTVTDPASGCRIEKEIRVNVTDLGDLEAIPSETILCQPNFVLLTARGAQGATFRWLDANGQVIFNGRNLSVTPAVGINLYIVEATLGACIKRDTAQIRLNDFKPGDLKSPQSICVGTSVELNPNGNPAYTYTWSPTTSLDLSKPYNPVASPKNTTTYTVTATDPASGCSTTKTIVVNVTQPVTVIALPDTSLCEPGRLTLRATTSRPTPITWFSDAALKNQIGTGNRISVNVPAGKTVFYAVAIDTNDVCIRAQLDSARNGGGGPGTGGGPAIGKGGPFEGVPLDSAVVDVVDITKGAPPSMITTCAGRPTPINPNGKPNLVYRWSPSTGLSDSTSATPSTIVTVPITYTVTISDPFGACSIVRQVVVMAAEPINANAGKDTTLCSLNPFNLVASGNGAVIFEWANNRNFSPVLGQGAQFAITPDTVAKTYYVRITNAAGCLETDSVTVIARPVRATLPTTVSACENGDEVTLIVTNNDRRQNLTYLWSPANLFITNVRTGPSATIVAQNGAQPQVLLTNQFGCTATLRTTVNVVDLESKVRVTANPNSIVNGESTTIRVENCPDCTYSWSPATGLNTTTGSTVIASPTDTTEYTVKVTSNGCTAELKITINVTGPYCVEPYIFVPTAFTPNKDGVNDVLYVRGRGIERMTFIIYNRWNQKMFETSDPKVGWDGTFRGKQLPPDVYGFYLLANCIDGTEYRKQGNVTLIR